MVKVLSAVITNVSRLEGCFVWPTDEDTKVRASQRPLHDFIRVFNRSIPVHLKDYVKFEVDYILESNGSLEVAVIALWDKRHVREQDFLELSIILKEKVHKSCDLLETIKNMINVDPCTVVVEGGMPSVVGNVIRDENIVCDITSALRKVATSSKNGISMKIRMDNTVRAISYEEHSLPSIDSDVLNESVVYVLGVSDSSLKSDLREGKFNLPKLGFEDEDVRLNLLEAQMQRKNVLVKWHPSTKWKNGRKEEVGGVIVSVHDAPQMSIEL